MFAGLPQLNALRVFESAARLGSFKAAADELHVTPTAVSHQIRSLEERLGIKLFQRQPRSVRLTESGARLGNTVNSALHQISSAIRDLSLARPAVTVATTPSFVALWLAPRLAEFERAHPDIEIRLQSGNAVVALEHQDVIDVAIRYGVPNRIPKDDPIVIRERFGAYYRPASLKRRRGHGPVLSRTDLIETQWTNPELPPIGWHDWLRHHAPHVTPSRIRRFDSQLHGLHAAMAGDGILLCSNVLAASAVAHGWLKPYRPGQTIDGLAYRLVTTPGRAGSTHVQTFKHWLQSGLGKVG